MTMNDGRTETNHCYAKFQIRNQDLSKPISTTAEALALAENERTVEYTQMKIYRDEAAGIWKIEYQIFYGYQGYQYVYLNDDGITIMVSGSGSKVEEWQAEYPGP